MDGLAAEAVAQTGTAGFGAYDAVGRVCLDGQSRQAPRLSTCDAVGIVVSASSVGAV